MHFVKWVRSIKRQWSTGGKKMKSGDMIYIQKGREEREKSAGGIYYGGVMTEGKWIDRNVNVGLPISLKKVSWKLCPSIHPIPLDQGLGTFLASESCLDRAKCLWANDFQHNRIFYEVGSKHMHSLMHERNKEWPWFLPWLIRKIFWLMNHRLLTTVLDGQVILPCQSGTFIIQDLL